MFKTTGIDHVAVNTNDMEATLQFYCGILGMRLARTSRTGDGRRHYNVEIGVGNAFAFFDGAERPDEAMPQYLNHFALPVATEAEFDEAYQRLKNTGVEVTKIVERSTVRPTPSTSPTESGYRASTSQPVGTKT